MKMIVSGCNCLSWKDLSGDVGAVGVVWDLRSDSDAGALGGLIDGCRDGRAVLGILIDDGDVVYRAAGFLQIVEELGVGGREVGSDGSGAEDPFEAASGNVQRDRIRDEEWNSLALRDGSGDERHRRMVGAEHGGDLLLRDQAQRLVLADLRIALVVGTDQLDFCAAQIRQAGTCSKWKACQLGMRAVDDLRSELDRILGRGAGTRGIAGQGIDNADLDRIGGARGTCDG